MKCPNCAANYDNSFNFCPYCGTSKSQPSTQAPMAGHKKRFEVCHFEQIHHQRGLIGPITCRWEASIAGRVIAKSPERVFKDDFPRGQQVLNQALVELLTEDGWEPCANDDQGRITAMKRELA